MVAATQTYRKQTITINKLMGKEIACVQHATVISNICRFIPYCSLPMPNVIFFSASAGLMNNFVMIEFELRKSQMMYLLKALLILMLQQICSVMSRKKPRETFVFIVKNILKHPTFQGMGIVPSKIISMWKTFPQAPQAHLMNYKLHHLEEIIYVKKTIKA